MDSHVMVEIEPLTLDDFDCPYPDARQALPWAFVERVVTAGQPVHIYRGDVWVLKHYVWCWLLEHAAEVSIDSRRTLIAEVAHHLEVRRDRRSSPSADDGAVIVRLQPCYCDQGRLRLGFVTRKEERGRCAELRKQASVLLSESSKVG